MALSVFGIWAFWNGTNKAHPFIFRLAHSRTFKKPEVFMGRATRFYFFNNEQSALVDQLRRAAQSIPANIAEGFGRHHYQDAVRFNYIARGSLLEVYSHITFAQQMGYLSDDLYNQLIAQLQEVHKTLNGYITFLKQSKQGESDLPHTTHEPAHLYTYERSDSEGIDDEIF